MLCLNFFNKIECSFLFFTKKQKHTNSFFQLVFIKNRKTEKLLKSKITKHI